MFSPGTRIGKYELGETLGQGTFGLVLTARDTELDRLVALKILNPSHGCGDSNEVLRRFLQEARAAARVSHPGIVTILDSGRYALDDGDEIAMIAMEKLEGESLARRLVRASRLQPETAAEFARQIATALDAAHRAGVLHRDLKPDNIYLVPDSAVPGGERAKVLDFGLAKFVDSTTTAMNTVFGTPRYMSPEQSRSSGMIDSRSDIYALGCILFELVTGRTPFEGELFRIIEGHQLLPPPRARALAPDVSPALDDLIDRMLAKNPDDRPESMAVVDAELRLAGAANNGVAATLMPADFKRLLPQDDAVTIGFYRPGVYGDSLVLAPTTHSPTPTHIIRPLQRRRSYAPMFALLIAAAIGVVLTVVSST
ncbi:MAG: serine/threonine-protein kinase [Kofleriaceae bacterium]